MAGAEPPGTRQAKPVESRAGTEKGRNPVARVWMPGVCLRHGLMWASWWRVIPAAFEASPADPGAGRDTSRAALDLLARGLGAYAVARRTGQDTSR
jgi:hypothetical protein